MQPVKLYRSMKVLGWAVLLLMLVALAFAFGMTLLHWSDINV